VPTIRSSQILCIGDLRSGQLRDLPIISQCENIQKLPIQKICIESAQLFHNHVISAHY